MSDFILPVPGASLSPACLWQSHIPVHIVKGGVAGRNMGASADVFVWFRLLAKQACFHYEELRKKESRRISKHPG